MPPPAEPTSYVLRLSCVDGPGIVAAVSAFLLAEDCTIVQSQQYGDPQSTTFFMRVEFLPVSGVIDLVGLRGRFAGTAERFGMEWLMADPADKARILIMVSKFGHCLNDLLFRTRIGALNIEVVAVVSNHLEFAGLVESYAIPYHHIPVTPETKAAAEEQLLGLIADLQVDLVVLARYMQVLSEDMTRLLQGRAINIHHSMLPSFKGARPYHQAHARGVKVIGATAHYITTALDEGPIIEQEAARMNHSMSPAEATAVGRDCECQALARALRWHTENRVLLNGDRTVVFH